MQLMERGNRQEKRLNYILSLIRTSRRGALSKEEEDYLIKLHKQDQTLYTLEQRSLEARFMATLFMFIPIQIYNLQNSVQSNGDFGNKDLKDLSALLQKSCVSVALNCNVISDTSNCPKYEMQLVKSLVCLVQKSLNKILFSVKLYFAITYTCFGLAGTGGGLFGLLSSVKGSILVGAFSSSVLILSSS